MVQMAVEWLLIREDEEWSSKKTLWIKRDIKTRETIKKLGIENEGS